MANKNIEERMCFSMRKIKYGKYLLLLIFVMSIVYSGGDVDSSKVVHADETTQTTYEDFYDFNELPKVTSC